MPSWNDRQKHLQNQLIPIVDLVTVISSFNQEQMKAFDMVQEHCQSLTPNDALHLIVLGVGGTGKSYLINGIRSLLQHNCVVAAATGKAACNIKAVTLHSLSRLSIGNRGRKDLNGKQLIELLACKQAYGIAGQAQEY